jgi:hypothetical protein
MIWRSQQPKGLLDLIATGPQMMHGQAVFLMNGSGSALEQA